MNRKRFQEQYASEGQGKKLSSSKENLWFTLKGPQTGFMFLPPKSFLLSRCFGPGLVSHVGKATSGKGLYLERFGQFFTVDQEKGCFQI